MNKNNLHEITVRVLEQRDRREASIFPRDPKSWQTWKISSVNGIL